MDYAMPSKKSNVSTLWKVAAHLCNRAAKALAVAPAALFVGLLVQTAVPAWQPSLHIRDINYDGNQGSGKCDMYIGKNRDAIQQPARNMLQVAAVDWAMLKGEKPATLSEASQACHYDPRVHGTSMHPGRFSNKLVANQL